MEKIIAVVVTYNRLNCLKRVIESLKNQTKQLDRILVVNNGSTDGTAEYLNTLEDIQVVTQENIGGSGGFWRGIKEASNFESDWIWCMDDDVYPRKDCLEKLLIANEKNVGILCPRRIQNNRVFYSECKKINLSNPFKGLHLGELSDEDIVQDKPVSIEGMVFEGPLIKQELVKSIGYPQKDLFIFYDDTDYSYRAIEAGYKVLYVPVAIMDNEYFAKDITRETLVNSQRWKLWYHIRNTSFFVKKHGKNPFFRHFGALGFPFYMIFAILVNLVRNNKYEFSDLQKLFKAYIYGKRGVLGKISF